MKCMSLCLSFTFEVKGLVTQASYQSSYMWYLPQLQRAPQISFKKCFTIILKSPYLYEEFFYILYTFFINLPEMKGKSPWCPLKLATCMQVCQWYIKDSKINGSWNTLGHRLIRKWHEPSNYPSDIFSAMSLWDNLVMLIQSALKYAARENC